MRVAQKIILLLVLIFLSHKNFAYTKTSTNIVLADTSEKAQKKAANKVANRMALYSTILPGLGQAFNKKYWKIPIIYAGLGALGYFIFTNNDKVAQCHKELLFRYSNTIYLDAYHNHHFKGYSADDVNTLRNDAKRNLDFCIIGASIVYLFNIIDANVDGHFRSFDMSDKLSLSIKPQSSFCVQSPTGMSVGLSIALVFKK